MSKPIIFSTPCSVSDLNRLQDDIIATVPLVLATVLKGSNLEIHSAIELIQDNKNMVVSVISNFVDSDITQQVPLIYSLTKAEAKNKHFHNIDYKREVSQALIPERDVKQGEVVEVIWYRDIDLATQALSSPVIKVDIVYTRDVATSFPLYRDTTRSYYNLDGTLNEEVKVTRKFYIINNADQISEGHKRRGLLVDSIQKPVMGMMAQVLMPLGYSLTSVVLKGRQFLDDYEVEFGNFIQQSSTVTNPSDTNFGKKTVIVKLEEEARTDVIEWMDKAPAILGGAVTIRQYLINEFDI